MGIKGKKVAKMMNKHHSGLTDWGIKKVKIKPTFTILDIGCGGGKTIQKLAKLVPQGKVLGIDHSKDMVDFAREINKEGIRQDVVSIVERSVERTDFPDNFFDLITAVETYYFWPSLFLAFKEIKRVLKSKGKIILINEMIQNGIYEIENAETIANTQVQLRPLEEIKKMLTKAGFVRIEIFTKKGSAWNVIIAQKP